MLISSTIGFYFYPVLLDSECSESNQSYSKQPTKVCLGIYFLTDFYNNLRIVRPHLGPYSPTILENLLRISLQDVLN